jgi:hypothetical protein
MTEAGIVPTRSRVRRPRGRALAVAGVLLLAAGLGGCTSTLSELPAAVGGLPAGTPEREATPVAYPAVHDMPPPRANTVLTEEEQKKAAAELAAARDKQAKRAASQDQ